MRIVAVWLLATLAYAAIYVHRVLQRPDLEGYESEWQFQVLAFCYSRLPLMLALLVAGLVTEQVVARRTGRRS